MLKLIVIMSVLCVTVVKAADEVEYCQEDKVCYPKSQVEKWNESIKNRKKHKCKPCPEQKIVEKVVEKQVIKHHIISVYAARDVSGVSASSSGSTATATVESAYKPGIKYQYQFNFGLVPEIGINTKGHPMFGLGYEF